MDNLTAPFQWQGITRDQSYGSGGAYYAQNVRFYIEGELQERRGLAYEKANTGNVMQPYLHQATGYWGVWVTSSGTIIADLL